MQLVVGAIGLVTGAMLFLVATKGKGQRAEGKGQGE
jgi:hypothetical protein